MQRAVIKSSDIVPPTPRKGLQKDLLAQGLVELIRALKKLFQRITTQIANATHAETVDEIALFRECELCLKEFHYLATAAIKVVGPAELKIDTFRSKKRFVKQESFPAHSWSPVVLLHLLREQAIGRRQQEIQEIEKKKKDIIQKLDDDVQACKECFAEIVPQLNLLCYMRDSLKEDHALPASVMYHTNIKETVRSPFNFVKPVAAPQARMAVKPLAKPPAQMDPRRQMPKQMERQVERPDLSDKPMFMRAPHAEDESASKERLRQMVEMEKQKFQELEEIEIDKFMQGE